MPEILAARRQTQVEQETQGQPGLYEIQPGLYEILPYIKNQKAKNKQKKPSNITNNQMKAKQATMKVRILEPVSTCGQIINPLLLKGGPTEADKWTL